MKFPLALGAVAVALACGAGPPDRETKQAPAPIARLRPKVLASWPHDPEAFTQGLVFHGGRLFESTGLYGRSELRQVELETGRPLVRRPLAPELFGEGLALGPGGLVQLTYQEGVALRWTTQLRPLGQYTYEGEGWGLTYDRANNRFIATDGSDRLTFRHVETFAVLGSVQVHRAGRPVANLNELEWIPAAPGGKPELWCNVWMTDTILRVDPDSGALVAEVDAGGLLDPQERAGADVLNGIAFDEGRRVFFVTGKLWPRLFEVVFE